MIQKEVLRDRIREKEKNFSPAYLRDSSEKITKRVLTSSLYKAAKSIFCFVGSGREPDTKVILRDALENGKILAVPLCREKGVMHAIIIEDISRLKKGRFGLLEPEDSCPVLPPEEIDLCIVPCLSCDFTGGRIGKGGGYYDRYLPQCSASQIALCRDLLITDKIPLEDHDQQMHQVITESGIYRTDNRRIFLI